MQSGQQNSSIYEKMVQTHGIGKSEDDDGMLKWNNSEVSTKFLHEIVEPVSLEPMWDLYL